MKINTRVRFLLSLLLVISLFMPIVALAGDGKKHFKEGLKQASYEQWDKAVESFALAVADNPKNPEYKLHYQRALFNASQMYMKRGNSQAEEKDYAGAYNSYRKAYAYDPTNQLAQASMEKMFRLQQELDGNQTKENENNPTNDPNLKLMKTSYQSQKDDVLPAKMEVLRDIIWPNGVDIQYLIRDLAKDLDLNVLFDEESFRSQRNIKIQLKGVTSAKALDYLFLQTGLFFQKVGPRTVIIANNTRRTNFQQLVLRTFYLANADPTDIAKIVQQAIPPQPGRTPTGVLTDKATNSITLRDTEENIRLMAKLIRSLDKDRAEVVMDVNIYEVSKNDLLQFGNQFGTSNNLLNLGGTSSSVIGLNKDYQRVVPVTSGSRESGTSGGTVFDLFKNATVTGAGLILPAANLQALQSKGNTRLLASTQVHAFNGEKSTAKIGQRVPVLSASYNSFGNNGTGGNNGIVGDVINYEQTGLTLEFEPIVFPNQDVQVKMKIESRDLAGTGVNDNPIFGERAISGSARIQNNRTLLLASVAQTSESNSRTGLPFLGLVPILGRMFTAPRKDNRQTDIVIAVTPRVLRAPTVLPEDEVERVTGSLATPTTGNLESMLIQEEREEQLAAARRLNNVAVQLPDAKKEDLPNYVPTKNVATGGNEIGGVTVKADEKIEKTSTEPDKNDAPAMVKSVLPTVKPIETSAVKTLQINQTSDKVESKSSSDESLLVSPRAELSIFPSPTLMKAGEKAQLQVIIKGDAKFRSSVLAFSFDPKKVAVKKISYGDVFGANLAEKTAVPYFNANGKIYVTMSAENELTIAGTDVMALIEIEALTDGAPEISFLSNVFNIINDNGQSFILSFNK